MLKQLDSLVMVHFHFARWERVRHRAQTIAAIEFPDSHPFRHTVDSMCVDLEECRRRADACSIDFMKQHGSFRGFINGFFFDSPSEMFLNAPEKYWDCPEYAISKGCQRRKIMDLAEIACMHTLETSGRSLITAVSKLAGGPHTGSNWLLDETTKVFEKHCQRMRKQMKRIKICPKQKLAVLLCLQRLGLPRETSTTILDYLV